jgi:hypothetical protein
MNLRLVYQMYINYVKVIVGTDIQHLQIQYLGSYNQNLLRVVCIFVSYTRLSKCKPGTALLQGVKGSNTQMKYLNLIGLFLHPN